jgi:hypothetical protein
MDTRIDELIRAFDIFDGRYKRDEVDEAITLRAEITPRLLLILEDVAENPAVYAAEEHYANVYAAILLAHFQEPAAHLPLIRAFNIPEEEREDLWGDMVTATLPALLYQTCNQSFETVRELACNREISDYVRGAALEALTYAVARGTLTREEVVDFFLTLFTGSEADPESDYWSNIVIMLCDLHPEGAMEPIRRAYEEGLVSPGYVGLDEVEKELARDKEKVLAELRVHTDRSIPADVHDYCSWFSCFREGGTAPPSMPESAYSEQTVAKTKGRKSAKKLPNRNKNKMARKSRKKNKR